MMSEILASMGMKEENIKTVVTVYLEQTRRGLGHHDINDFVTRMCEVDCGMAKPNPEFKMIASFKQQTKTRHKKGIANNIRQNIKAHKPEINHYKKKTPVKISKCLLCHLLNPIKNSLLL